MKLLIILLLLLSSWTAAVDAAAPVVTCTPNRTSGTAPLAIIVDCTSTTDADTAKPTHDLRFWTTFGDPGAGVWANGAIVNAAKNGATGPVVGHVYETARAAPYIITTYVTDGVNIVRATNSITVADPNTTFAGTATVCIFNSVVGTGCPTGATEAAATSDFDVSLAACAGATKRCLYKRGGDTFTADADTTISAAGPIHIGSYGTGANPVITVNNSADAILINNAAVNDLRVVDLTWNGTGVGGTENVINQTAPITNLLVLRLAATNLGGALQVAQGVGANTCTGCITQESTSSAFHTTAAMYGWWITGAIMGNNFGPVGVGGAAEHVLRMAVTQKVAIVHNTLTTPAATKTTLTLRAAHHVTDADDSFFTYVAYNDVTIGTAANNAFGLDTVGGATDPRHYDFWIEKNHFKAGAYTGATTVNVTKFGGQRITFRNNLIDASGPTVATRVGMFVASNDVTNDDIDVYNNTIYASDAGLTHGGLINTGVTDTRFKNNLCYFPNETGASTCLTDGGTGTVATTNTGDIGTITTNPSFTGPTTTPIGFRFSTTSYAASGGTAIFPASNDDFYGCDDITANEHIGAFVPRLRARCRGAAGP